MTELLATAGTQRSLLPALIKGCFHVIQRRLRADTEFTERIFQAYSQIQLEGEKIQGYSFACSWLATRRALRWRCRLGLERRHAAPQPALPRCAWFPLSLLTLPVWAHIPQHTSRVGWTWGGLWDALAGETRALAPAHWLSSSN